MRFGKITDEPIGDYHAADAVSKTKLDTFRHNPDLFRRVYVTKEAAKPEPTEAMIIGNAAGALILEGAAAYDDRYVVVPEGCPRRPTDRQRNAKKPSHETLDAIAWWDAFADRIAHKQILTFEQDLLVHRLQHAAFANPIFCELVHAGQPEVTFRIQGKQFAVQVRPDWWNEDGCALTDGYPYIVDLKTIASLPQDDPDFLGKHIASYGYHRSAYLYPEVAAQALGWKHDLPRPRFFLAFVEKEEPFHCEVVELGELDVEIGQREVTDSLTKLRRCLETGVWTTARTKPRTVALPGYYVRRALETSEPQLV